MGNTHEFNLKDVHQTLLLPLWGRAMEMKKAKPLLIDHKAVKIINSLSYDFSVIAQNISPLSRAAWIARSLYFDAEIKAFIEKHPHAAIVNIGCGMDTTFERVDNGEIRWFDLDVPEVIALRKQFFTETDRNRFIAKSVFEKSWINDIKQKDDVLFLLGGVIYYFNPEQVRDLFRSLETSFSDPELVFDYSSNRGVKMANKVVIEKGGMSKASYLQWGFDDIHALTDMNPNVEIINHMPMFRAFKKHYPLYKRIGFNISDLMKIMSLAHIRIKSIKKTSEAQRSQR